jgi:hypothetical protein
MNATLIRFSRTWEKTGKGCPTNPSSPADLFCRYDPLGFEAGDANLFRYVHNSATNATDPSGLGAIKDIKVKLGKKDLGSLSIDWDTDKKGRIIAVFRNEDRKKYDNIGKIADAIKADHFNWYQIITSQSLPLLVDARTDKYLKAPRIDPAPGGHKQKPKGKVTDWADDLPWYDDEGKEPPKNTEGYHPGTFMFPLFQRFEQHYFFTDSPASIAKNGKITFKTWLVALDKKGQLVAFLQGFTWEYVKENGKARITNVKLLKEEPTTYEYELLLLIGGFVK